MYSLPQIEKPLPENLPSHHLPTSNKIPSTTSNSKAPLHGYQGNRDEHLMRAASTVGNHGQYQQLQPITTDQHRA